MQQMDGGVFVKIVSYLIFSFLLISFGYFVFRVRVRRDYERKGKLSVLSTSLEFLIFALHANFSYAFLPAKWPAFASLPDSSLHSSIGLGIIAIGLATTLWTMGGLGFRKAFGQQVDTLYRSGLYRHSRNPQIVAYGLAMVGIALLWPSFYALGWVLIYAALAHMMVSTEEEHLRKVYGAEYEEYCGKVARYVPRPW